MKLLCLRTTAAPLFDALERRHSRWRSAEFQLLREVCRLTFSFEPTTHQEVAFHRPIGHSLSSMNKKDLGRACEEGTQAALLACLRLRKYWHRQNLPLESKSDDSQTRRCRSQKLTGACKAKLPIGRRWIARPVRDQYQVMWNHAQSG
jgi:hypothetical protein